MLGYRGREKYVLRNLSVGFENPDASRKGFLPTLRKSIFVLQESWKRDTLRSNNYCAEFTLNIFNLYKLVFRAVNAMIIC